MSITRADVAALAIEGGRPVRATLLPYGRHTIHEEDIRAVVNVLRSARLTSGSCVAAFEEAFADFVGATHAVSFSSGTGALHGAVAAAGLAAGDEAITTPLTFCATANCVLYQGAKPVLADVREDTLTLDPDQVEQRLSPRTKAVLPMDYAGHPADGERFMALAERYGLLVIEDACHALGARDQDRPIGQISHMTIFSFHPVKHITTGEGGMVTTNDAELARRLRRFRNHGIDLEARGRHAEGPWRYDMVCLGYNYRLADIGCALGLSQLRRVEHALARRREIAARYSAAFQNFPELIPPTVRSNTSPAWHLYPLRLHLSRFRVGKAEVYRALQAEGVGVNVHFLPVHLHSYYRERFGYQGGEYPVAERAYEQLLTLPLFDGMSDHDVDDVIAAVEKVRRAYAVWS